MKLFLISGLSLLYSLHIATAAPPTYRVFATREGLVGHTTANGHVITSSSRFVALPSRTVLNAFNGYTYTVNLKNPRNGRVMNNIPVWDVGPWNCDDNYWSANRSGIIQPPLPRGKPQAQAAYYENHHGGYDFHSSCCGCANRQVANGAGIDFSEGVWSGLAMTGNDWVDVTYNWESAGAPVKDHVEVFARSSSGTLTQKSYGPSGWGGWIDLGGSITGGVGVCSRNSSEVLVFARGSALNNLQQKSYTTSAGWGNWVGLGGTLTSDPTAIAWGSSGTGVLVFARSSTGTVIYKSYSGGNWGPWIDLGGSITGGVAVCSRNANEVIVFARGSALNNLQQISYSASTGWGNWVGLGGTLTSDPAAIARSATNIEVFARSSSGTLIQKSYNSGWTPNWIDLGGSITGGVGVTARNSDEVLIFSRGSAVNNLQQKSYTTSSGWGNWVGLGGTMTSDPEALAW